MRDIPLAVAVLCWNPDGFGEVTFQVRELGDPFNDHGPHMMTAGAVYSKWQQGDANKKLLMLFGAIMTIMARDGVPFELIHPELLKIPEYRRDVLAGDAPGGEGEGWI